MNHLRVAAICLVDSQARLLTVRKRGTRAFMLPGGKPEPGEGLMAAAIREVAEETGLSVDVLAPLGRWRTQAANEPSATIEATVFVGRLIGTPTPMSEIDELAWIDIANPSRAGREFAPLMADVFAALAEFSDSSQSSTI